MNWLSLLHGRCPVGDRLKTLTVGDGYLELVTGSHRLGSRLCSTVREVTKVGTTSSETYQSCNLKGILYSRFRTLGRNLRIA